MNQGASSERQIPRSALLAVNDALTTIHSAVGLRPTLEAIADGVTVSTPYQDVAELRVIAVIGPPDAVALLLNTTCQRTALLEHLADGEAWGSLRFLPTFESADGIITCSLDPAAFTSVGRVDERFQSYNVEMAEIIGGTSNWRAVVDGLPN